MRGHGRQADAPNLYVYAARILCVYTLSLFRSRTLRTPSLYVLRWREGPYEGTGVLSRVGVPFGTCVVRRPLFLYNVFVGFVRSWRTKKNGERGVV